MAAAIRQSIDFTLSTFARAGADGRGADIGYVEEGAENPFLVYGRAGAPCPRRHRGPGPSLIVRIVQAGRATFFCPRCQGQKTARASARVGA
jgi:formamidopyrimidine-DNA glycosylase